MDEIKHFVEFDINYITESLELIRFKGLTDKA